MYTIGGSTCYLGNNYSLDTPHFPMYNMTGAIGRAANQMHLASQPQKECAVAVGNELSRGFNIYFQKNSVTPFILASILFSCNLFKPESLAIALPKTRV